MAAIDNKVGAGMSDDKIKRTRIRNTVVASHFPTVFMVREYDGGDALNRKLEELMLRLEKETTNIASHTSNIGGFHSETNFFSRQEPEVTALRDLVQQALDDYVRSSSLPTAMFRPPTSRCACGDGASTCAPATSTSSTCTRTPRSAASTT